MANKKKPVPAGPVETGVDEIVADEAATGLDWPGEPMRTRLETLLKRRGPFGSLVDTIKPFWHGDKLPETDDDWMAIIKRLER